MCNPACLDFGKAHLTREDIQGKNVIDVGSCDVNGSLRPYVESLGPAGYLGVDLAPGPGVDDICDISRLVERYGEQSFDVVISTEVLEHVRDWRGAVSNLKRLLRPQGILLVTTRSRGFPYHGYPYDFWRYETEDIQAIFSDLSIELIERDRVSPGIFVRAVKPVEFHEKRLDGINLFSIVTHRRSASVTAVQIVLRRLRHKTRRTLSRVLPPALMSQIDALVGAREAPGDEHLPPSGGRSSG